MDQLCEKLCEKLRAEKTPLKPNERVCANCDIYYNKMHSKNSELLSALRAINLGKERFTNVPLMKCGACKSVYYCSRDCQIADWKNHKLVCNKDID